MAASFFFYDLETSGISSSTARIMQFAGQRTDMDLQPIGEPVNVLIKLAGDVLPEPDAIMITGITPQSTIQEGLTEAEFLKYFYEEVVQPDTCFLGYNTVRFDDEFMRNLHYRNFYDPYGWQWQQGCSRWDLLDLVRMTRALRPEGISWPVTDEGRPTNRLELLTVANKLNHEKAHDALSDVFATIAMADLIKQKQPDLFKYLYEHRGKKAVQELADAGQPFIYTSGRYPSDCLHTTVVTTLAKHGSDIIVYDLRQDPQPFLDMTPEDMVESWKFKNDRPADYVRLPVKTMRPNRCPAVAPLGVIKDPAIQERLAVPLDKINEHLSLLRANHKAFTAKVLRAVELLDEQRAIDYPRPSTVTAENVDGQIYAGFISDDDKQAMSTLRATDPAAISGKPFRDKRLQLLAPLYKARNYPSMLSGDERAEWDRHVAAQLFDGGPQSRLAQYFARLQELAAGQLDSQKEYLLEELQLYGESVMPTDASEQ